MTALENLLTHYRTQSKSEREKGTYFEELITCYLRNEATYRDLYSQVWTYSDWAQEQGIDGLRDYQDFFLFADRINDTCPIIYDVQTVQIPYLVDG